ncbi:MAG: nucleotide exchange factor GrpE [Brumimicrobium sp.]|nr:nucleotide exchange factor GrpE [Brumimicrobium sp.]
MMGRKDKKLEENKQETEDNKAVEQNNDEKEVQEETIETVSEEETLSAKIEELNDKYMRLYSEFDNFRRRTSKEKLEILANASEDVIRDLLPVLDVFERAIENNEKSSDAEAIKEGFQLIYGKLNSILVGKGLKPMESIGTTFDVEQHEAITNIPAPDADSKGKVMDVVEKGYFLNDKVIRYAKVVVGQ